MRLDRTKIRKGRMKDLDDDGFVQGTMEERLSMVWEITASIWEISTKGRINAESRLQRDIAVLKRRKG